MEPKFLSGFSRTVNIKRAQGDFVPGKYGKDGPNLSSPKNTG
jgi:hypothetical protein